MSEKVLDKFLRYAKIDTQSDESSETTPSTTKQFDLGNLLQKELFAMGLKDAEIDEHCYVMATIPSNLPADHPAFGKVPTIGFVAHVDTSPDVTDTNVKPQIIENYQGGDIVLPGDTSIVIRESENPELANSIGHTLVTTDGTTLLGSDDKAGVAAIMKMAEMMMEDNSILHGPIRIGFTPDEEIGQGTKFFNIEKFGCKYAYTIDGEMPGELNKETFSANGGVIRIKGRDIHPHSVEGGIGEASIKILFRDFRTEGLPVQKEILEKVIAEVQEMYPKAEIVLDIKEQYRNMLDTLEKNPEVLENLFEAATRTGTNPYWKPIRGGTDGSRLTEMGLPTPNIYNGGNNFHSKSEWLNVNALEKTVDTIINVAKVYVEKAI